MTEVCSFDVFDTLITRAVGSPTSLFLLLGRRLQRQGLISCSAEAFARSRVRAETRARLNVERGDVTLHSIYLELGTALQLTPFAREKLMDEECRLESELLQLVPEGQRRVQEARLQGKRILFVSDMYLPSGFITGQLLRFQLLETGREPCYVSCEHGHSKRSRELYREVLRGERLTPGQVTHTGNDPEADVTAARDMGLHATPFTQANLNRYEEILESHVWETEGLSSALAAASRQARLTVAAHSPAEAALRDVAAGVTAPTLVGYVLWVLQRARQLGLDRLYFISRDGQVLREIARRLAPRLGLSCELRYLYGSRQAWHMPSIRSLEERHWHWILDPTDYLSIRSFLARLCMEPEEIERCLDRQGIGPMDWSRNLTSAERSRVHNLLLDETVSRLIRERAAQKRELVVQYLRNEGMAEPGSVGIVDIGWHGRIQDSLATILADTGAAAPRGFYFGLVSGRSDDSLGSREAYLFDGRHALGARGIGYETVPLLEVFCAADHGTVVGYQHEGSAVTPQLRSPCNQPVIDWGLPLLQETVFAFTDHLLLCPDLLDPHADLRPVTAELLEAFWSNPTPLEAMAWGAFPYEDDQTGAYWTRLAAAYSWKHVQQAIRDGELLPHHRTSWKAGSLAMTPPSIRSALHWGERLGRFRRRALRAGRRLLRGRCRRGGEGATGLEPVPQSELATG